MVPGKLELLAILQEGSLKGEEATGQHVSLCLSPFCCTGCGLAGLHWVSRGLMGQALSTHHPSL